RAERLAVGLVLLPLCDVDGAVDVLGQDEHPTDDGQERGERFDGGEGDSALVDDLDASDAVGGAVLVLLRALDDAYLREATARVLGIGHRGEGEGDIGGRERLAVVPGEAFTQSEGERPRIVTYLPGLRHVGLERKRLGRADEARED